MITIIITGTTVSPELPQNSSPIPTLIGHYSIMQNFRVRFRECVNKDDKHLDDHHQINWCHCEPWDSSEFFAKILISCYTPSCQRSFGLPTLFFPIDLVFNIRCTTLDSCIIFKCSQTSNLDIFNHIISVIQIVKLKVISSQYLIFFCGAKYFPTFGRCVFKQYGKHCSLRL